MSVQTSTTIEVSSEGAVQQLELDRAVEKVRSVAERAREPVHHLEVRVQLGSNPTHERPALAEATIDVNGRKVRAHVAAATVGEAVDDLIDRLRARLDRYEDRLHQLHMHGRTGVPGPGEWHHGDLPSSRPPWLDLPVDERDIRRRKTLAMAPMSVDEAAFDLVQLDHIFYLFVDEATGCDATISRVDHGPFELQHATPQRAPVDSVAEVNLIDAAAPVLSESDAAECLAVSGAPFLFFVSNRNGRGHVLYRRCDGHYGLIGPR